MGSPRQLHATLFDGRPQDLNSSAWDPKIQAAVDAGDVVSVLRTGHKEKNPYNSVYVYRHLRGIGYDADAGAEGIAELLVEETTVEFAPSAQAITLAGNVVTD